MKLFKCFQSDQRDLREASISIQNRCLKNKSKTQRLRPRHTIKQEYFDNRGFRVVGFIMSNGEIFRGMSL